MGPEARVAFVLAQVACAHAELAAMQAENQHRLSLGHTIAYDHAAFMRVQTDYMIGHNVVVEYLRGC